MSAAGLLGPLSLYEQRCMTVMSEVTVVEGVDGVSVRGSWRGEGGLLENGDGRSHPIHRQQSGSDNWINGLP